MEISLLTKRSSLEDMETFAAFAALTCHANADKPYIPSEVLKRIIKAGHESILEHITLTYSVKGLSRACLQELARHRHISLSVESTRHTLKEKLQAYTGGKQIYTTEYAKDITMNFPEGTGIEMDEIGFLRLIFEVLKGIDLPEDQLKYFVPECLTTNLVLTANVRELRHIIELRTAPAALKEFRILAYALFEAVPEEYRYLLEDCVYKESEDSHE